MNFKVWSQRLAAAMFFCFSLGVCAADVIPPMHVRIAPEVRKQIEQMPTQEKARVDKAMKIAQRFLTMRFAGQDLVADSVLEDSQRWDRRVAPLMAMDGFQWMLVHERERWEMAAEFNVGNRRVGGILVSCDRATLTKLDSRDSGYALTYQSPLLGINPNSVDVDFFEQAATYQLTALLNNDLKVQSLITPDKRIAVNIQYALLRKKKSLSYRQRPEIKEQSAKQYMKLQQIANTCNSNQ